LSSSENDCSNVQTSKKINGCLDISEDFDSNKISHADCNIKNPLPKNGVLSTPFKSIKTTEQVTSNNSHFNSNNTCASKIQLQSPDLANSLGSSETQFSRQSENDIESPLITNDVNSSETLLSKHCMDMSDDSIIPPTPSPVDNSKNTSRISISVNKNERTKTSGYFSNKEQRNYKHIKKPSISLSRNLGRSKLVPKKTQRSMSDQSLHISESVKENLNKSDFKDSNDYKMDEDLISFSGNNKINANGKDVVLDGGTSIRSSSLKLSRKTFKLSRKGKKPETEKPCLSNKKLEPDGCDNDILSAYGVQGNIVGNALVKDDQNGNGNDDFRSKESRPQVRTRGPVVSSPFSLNGG
jgi:hypothetical protein